MAFAADLDPDTMHFGALPAPDAEPLGIASIYRASPPAEFHAAHPALTSNFAWQLRGMATHPSIRRGGIGGQLLTRCPNHITTQRGTVFWCNARTAYRAFYEHFGLQAFGPEFTPAGIGPHYFMFKPMD